ncbi:MAG: acyltransferase, partial [Gammaproteobacteria bacterium]|nr:acyltransferase [Gammaproteobacteria bacterium]
MRFHFLDGFRAWAVLLILFHHSTTSFFVKLLNGINLDHLGFLLSSFTQSGVELFFVLSGVVLMRPYLRSKKEFNWRTYIKRRFIRIYPPYFGAVLFASAVIALNTYFPTWYSAILLKFNVHSFIKQFFLFNQKWDFFNLAWWSLQIEILFYLTVPVIVLLLAKWHGSINIIGHILIILVISLFSQYLMMAMAPNNYSFTVVYANLFRSVDYIACFYLGVCLARKDYTHRDQAISFIIGVLLIVLSYYYKPFVHMGFGFIYFSIISMAFSSPWVSKYLEAKNLVWLGERSYSLFLIHFSVFYLTNYLVSYFVDGRSILYGVLTRGIGV